MRNKSNQIVLGVTALLLLFYVDLFAQRYDKFEGGGAPDPQLSQKDNDYIDRQAAVFLDSVLSILNTYPPAPIKQEARERAWAKLLLDAVFHEHFAAQRKPVQQFFHQRIGQVINDLESTKVEYGAKVWKIYDMGFIVRTKSVTLAFDLVSGITSSSEDFALSPEEIGKLVGHCDVLFISHRHEDHAEKSVAAQFIVQNKPVVAPEQMWKDDPLYDKITHLERMVNKSQKLKLADLELDLVIFPGHQMRSIDNNVALVTTPDGITVAHLGDQINEGDFMLDYQWIDKVGTNYNVDILMPAAWTMDILRIVKEFNPKVVLPGHELELGHTVWDRLPYWGDDEYLELNYNMLKQSEYPVVVLTWGESFFYQP
ncbi:MBL fold metallo-hydrolase [Prolixibacteraceae bacterium Z1-6]|uniref:MBL fold metallo-hydrolase n=1 Tax=Draconibacterium aestuarii TaxID=2998507 RepID=A0A9X3J8M3_9BACT|nr:MBL fold metallo-hydrolase [Prolixibacteraceae bacterium Z1-6]